MNIWDLSSLGTEFAFIFVGFVMGGNYIDEKFESTPFGIMFGSILGFTFSIYYIIKRTNDFKNKNKMDK